MIPGTLDHYPFIFTKFLQIFNMKIKKGLKPFTPFGMNSFRPGILSLLKQRRYLAKAYTSEVNPFSIASLASLVLNHLFLLQIVNQSGKTLQQNAAVDVSIDDALTLQKVAELEHEIIHFGKILGLCLCHNAHDIVTSLQLHAVNSSIFSSSFRPQTCT